MHIEPMFGHPLSITLGNILRREDLLYFKKESKKAKYSHSQMIKDMLKSQTSANFLKLTLNKINKFPLYKLYPTWPPCLLRPLGQASQIGAGQDHSLW
jgi:hypothetical protein